MAYMQLHKPTHGKHDTHSMMTCQTTCQGTTTTGPTYNQGYGGANHGHNVGAAHGFMNSHGPIPVGHNVGAAHGFINSYGPSPVQGYSSHGTSQVHGYNSHGTSQVHGYNSHGTNQMHGYNSHGTSQVHGAPGACYGKQQGGLTEKVKKMFGRRKHRTRGVNGGNTSCSSSDSESDDEGRRRC